MLLIIGKKMILLMSDVEQNKKGGKQLIEQYSMKKHIVNYPHQLTSDNTINKLYLIDLTGVHNPYFTKTPREFANELIDMGLPSNITDIYLLISDLEPTKSLISFCNQLASAFKQYHDRQIFIHCPAKLGYEVTIVALSSNNKWKIYGLYLDQIDPNKIFKENNQLDFDFIDTINDKTLLWEGVNIDQYLSDAERTYNGESYVWSV